LYQIRLHLQRRKVGSGFTYAVNFNLHLDYSSPVSFDLTRFVRRQFCIRITSTLEVTCALGACEFLGYNVFHILDSGINHVEPESAAGSSINSASSIISKDQLVSPSSSSTIFTLCSLGVKAGPGSPRSLAPFHACFYISVRVRVNIFTSWFQFSFFHVVLHSQSKEQRQRGRERSLKSCYSGMFDEDSLGSRGRRRRTLFRSLGKIVWLHIRFLNLG